MSATDKILEKLAKLKAHAESAAKIGSEAEAQAFAGMLQRLLLEHKLEMSDVEMSTMEKEEPVGEHQVQYPEDIKIYNHRVLWIEKLAGTIARAHFCRILVDTRSSRITLVGRKTDVEIAEYMFIVLQRAAEKLAVIEEKTLRVYNKLYKTMGEMDKVKNTRNFKETFLYHFITRLQERYEAERTAAVGTNSMALVRLSKADLAAQKWIDDLKAIGAVHSVGAIMKSRLDNSAGRERGRELANGMSLRANAVKPGGSQKRLGE